MRESGVTVHDRLLSKAEAIVQGDHQFLGILLEQYERDVDLHSFATLLRNAVNRRALEGIVNLLSTCGSFLKSSKHVSRFRARN